MYVFDVVLLVLSVEVVVVETVVVVAVNVLVVVVTVLVVSVDDVTVVTVSVLVVAVVVVTVVFVVVVIEVNVVVVLVVLVVGSPQTVSLVAPQGILTSSPASHSAHLKHWYVVAFPQNFLWSPGSQSLTHRFTSSLKYNGCSQEVHLSAKVPQVLQLGSHFEHLQ